MKKTPSLFKRDYDGTRLVLDEVVPGSEWVTRGEGEATLKVDGTSCLVRGGALLKRHDRKLTKSAARRKKRGARGPWQQDDFKSAPGGWTPCEPEPNQHTGHWPGWLPVGDGPEDQWHREAFGRADFEDGTYELVGPKIQGNPHGLERHELWGHGDVVLVDVPTTYDGLRDWLEAHEVEGIVWHHPDGRMVKIKRRDFGFDWP